MRGIDRTLEYAEYTEEERPVSIQIFGGDPAKMAEAARDRRGHGRRHRRHQHGLSRAEDRQAQRRLQPDARAGARGERRPRDGEAVHIPVTVKMRAGWNDQEINAPSWRGMVEDAGAAAIAVHGRTAAQSYTGESDWSLIARVAPDVGIPVFGSGDCVEAEPGASRVARLGVSPACSSVAARCAIRGFSARRRKLAGGRVADAGHARGARGSFCSTISICCSTKRVDERDGFRHVAPGQIDDGRGDPRAAASVGSSTSFARWAPGIQRASRTDRTFASLSTRRVDSRRCGGLSRTFFLARDREVVYASSLARFSHITGFPAPLRRGRQSRSNRR